MATVVGAQAEGGAGPRLQHAETKTSIMAAHMSKLQRNAILALVPQTLVSIGLGVAYVFVAVKQSDDSDACPTKPLRWTRMFLWMGILNIVLGVLACVQAYASRLINNENMLKAQMYSKQPGRAADALACQQAGEADFMKGAKIGNRVKPIMAALQLCSFVWWCIGMGVFVNSSADHEECDVFEAWWIGAIIGQIALCCCTCTCLCCASVAAATDIISDPDLAKAMQEECAAAEI
eukprot:CAMPEP_0170296832 /NCGR_PEP_ID=MMETSP0116_2-20130129/48569_1 /TAXON_ID=400756 /ORGANISM="Durinskia baltica, Strain CSIRO CS-38" /LENGTH=234 /DNA_ID=CAMNT_0010548441 /DNA_START=1 /DNA_END=705 /DNA_ORIENTATION=-